MLFIINITPAMRATIETINSIPSPIYGITVQRQLEEKYNVMDWDMSDPIKRLAWRIVTTQLAKARFLVDIQPWDAGAEDQKERLVKQNR